MTGRHPDEFSDLAASYAMHALPAAEAAEFEQHLEGCAACQGEVDGLRVPLAHLAARSGSDAASSGEVAARLRPAVLREIAHTPQEPPLPRTSGAAPVRRRPVTATGTSAHARRTPRRGRLLLASAAAAVLVLGGATAGLGVAVAGLHGRVGQLQADQRSVQRVLGAPDASVSTASGASGVSARLVVSQAAHAGVLVATGLPQAPGGRTYQAWYISAGSIRSAGTFAVGPDGRVLVPLGAAAPAAGTIGISLEPAGGSTQPTTTPLLAVPVQS